MKVTYVCSACNSKSVTLDAWAEWDEDTQRWVLGATFDYSYCHDCDCEQRIEEIALDEASLRPAD